MANTQFSAVLPFAHSLVYFLTTGIIRSDCPRDKSRVVQNVVNSLIYPAFEAVKLDVPASCPFHSGANMYGFQENHKYMETHSKWSCGFCGKAFYAEAYLDLHLENRHSEHVKKGPETGCLADYCDIFRCDVIAGMAAADFWDTALCIEDDMLELQDDCMKAFARCIPADISKNLSQTLKGSIYDSLCSKLSCSSYWDTGQTEIPNWKLLTNTFLTAFLLCGMLVYYLLACQHFYSEPLFEEPHYRQRPFSNGAARGRVRQHVNTVRDIS